MSRGEWLERRRKTIGGSDAAAIIGLNDYSSPYTVWADKLGKLPEKEDSEPMRLGRDLEDYAAKRFTEKTGKKVRKENAMLYNPQYPFAHADVDRMVVGEDAGLECKTTSIMNLKKFKNGEYPAHYYVQCVHYLAVTGCKRWYLGVLVLGEGFHDFVIERDEEEIAALMESEEAFWKYVESQIPPSTDGSKATTETISTIFPVSNDDSVINLGGFEASLREYTALSAQIKSLEALKEEQANKIKAFMGEAGKGESSGYKVSWSTTSRSTFDAKRFAAEHSGLDLSRYYKTSTYRTFKISEK
jgi:putative phage-type endonuclease